MTHPLLRRTAPLLAAALTLGGTSLALAQSDPPLYDPSRRTLVDRPCGDPLPRGTRCTVAAILSPATGEVVLLTPDTTSFTLRGVAERERPVFIYLLEADGTLINQLPREAQAGTDGRFSVSLPLMDLRADRSYIATAFFLSTQPENASRESFYQVTGQPEVQFTYRLPAIPPPSCGNGRVEPELGERCDPGLTPTCTPTCLLPVEGCTPTSCDAATPTCGDTTTGRDNCGNACQKTGPACTSDCLALACPDMFNTATPISNTTNGMIVNGAFAIHTIYSLQERGSWNAAFDQNLTSLFRQSVVAEIRAHACPMIQPGTVDLLPPILRAFQQCQRRTGTATILNPATSQVRASLQATPCTDGERRSRPEGTTYNLCDRIGDVEYILVQRNAVEGACRLGGTCYHFQVLTGVSPLLFVTSGAPAQVQVAVHPAVGSVLNPDPPLLGDAWSVEAREVARPLYYEFEEGAAAMLAHDEGRGWTVAARDAEALLRRLLLDWGYDADEAEAFLARDVRGSLPTTGTLELRVADSASVDRALPLRVTPAPARVERLLFVLRPVRTPRVLRAPDVAPYLHAGASGLTVREFGAVLVAE